MGSNYPKFKFMKVYTNYHLVQKSKIDRINASRGLINGYSYARISHPCTILTKSKCLHNSRKYRIEIQNLCEKNSDANRRVTYLSLILLLLRCSVTECFDLMALALSIFFPSALHIKSHITKFSNK